MIKNRLMMGALAASAALVPIAGVSALTATAAGAAPTGIKCSGGSGPVNASTFTATINFTGCSGNTGTTGTTTDSQGQTTMKITWGNTKTTTLKLKSPTTGTLCTAPAGSTLLADEILKGTVTADKTKSTAVGAKAKGEFCVDSDSSSNITINLLPGSDFKIAA